MLAPPPAPAPSGAGRFSNVQISTGLGNANATFRDQLHGLGFELTAVGPSCHYLLSSSRTRSYRCVHETGSSSSFNIPGEQVDAMDVRAVYEAGKRAVERASAGEGPFILEMLTYRYRGHSMSDPARYRSRDEVQKMKTENDPIDRVMARLLNDWGVPAEELKEIENRIKAVVLDAVDFATTSPEPDLSELYTDVYA